MENFIGEDVTVIRDSLYSQVPIGEHVRALISTSQFLRLQRIKQLGWVYVVWPGATHTRYEHSLGVYYLARKALEHLIRLGKNGGLEDPQPGEIRTVLAAALLHDIGHYPYSHGIEELGTPVLPHEEVGATVIGSTEVSSVLWDWGVDPHRVISLIAPSKSPEHEINGRWLIYRSLLSGALDIDKIDYLPRDAQACNVPYGRVDTERLIASLRVLQFEGSPHLAITDKGISALHSLIRARQEMFDNVYWHHTNRACMVMLLRAIQDAIEAGVLSSEDLINHDDYSLIALLLRSDMPDTTRSLVESLVARRLHKRAIEFSVQAGVTFQRLNSLFYHPGSRKELEIRLANILSELTGLEVMPHEILIDIPKPERWDVDALVVFRRPPIGLNQIMTWSEATGMRSHDLSAYESYQRRIRIVTTQRLRDRVWTLKDRLIGELIAPSNRPAS